MKSPGSPENQGGYGSVIVMTLFVLITLGGLTTAAVSINQKNLKQAHYFAVHSELHQYAESGIALAIHDFDNYLTGNLGNIGTGSWTTANDVGADGLAGTLDTGEDDGIPTPGEPQLAPVSIGPAALQARLLVAVYPTPYTGVFRIVSTCYNDVASFTEEKVFRNQMKDFSVPAPMYVAPETQLVFEKNTKLLIDGNDQSVLSDFSSLFAFMPTSSSMTKLDPLHGMATTQGELSGDNLLALLSQLPGGTNIQILGKDGAPSLGEVANFDFSQNFDTFRGKATRHLPPGAYANLDLGIFNTSVATVDTTLMGEEVVDYSSSLVWIQNTQMQEFVESFSGMTVTYVDGDVQLSGECGKALLVVNGGLKMIGPAKFQGFLVVRGDVELKGGTGDGIQITGGILSDSTELRVSGNTSISYNSDLVKQFREDVRMYYPLFYTER